MEEENPSGFSLTRVFVGGLGATVTESDVEKTFSSLGKVEGVEIIRTNERSFAYMDFEPSSEKSLGKLFSMYNGCSWKGGRLKLEKAKEHYLVRLKREWAEDAELERDTPKDIEPDKSVISLEESKKFAQEKMQLQIFFPRLRKVKLLPYSGTGKHKYSFQRIEVPPLPVHFCDCEEHLQLSETAGRNHLSTITTHKGGINEKELNVMSSVMNKLFEREKAGHNGIVSSVEGNNPDHIIDDMPFDEGETGQSTEEDNLVTNIVMEDASTMGLVQTNGWQATFAKKGSMHSKDQLSYNEPTRKRPKPQDTCNTSGGLKKARRHPSVEANRDESTSTKTDEEKISQIHSKKLKSTEVHPINNQTNQNTSESAQGRLWAQKSSRKELVGQTSKFSLSDVLPKKLEGSVGVQSIETQPNSGTGQPTKGRSWEQKSSWKELVGQTNSSLFSLSDVLPGISCLSKKSKKTKDSKPTLPAQSGQKNLTKYSRVQSDGEGPKHLQLGKQQITNMKFSSSLDSKVELSEKPEQAQSVEDPTQSIQKENLQNMEDDVSGLVEETERKVEEEPKAKAAIAIGEVCTFMRSAASEKEWMKARTALSGSLKKKNSNNVSKNSKGMSSRSY